MNWIDLALLGVIGLALGLGFQRGFIKQVFTISGIVLGIVLAGKYHAQLAGRIELEPFVNSVGLKTVTVVAYLGIFIFTLLLAQGIGHGMRLSLQGQPLCQIDSLLGALLGAAKACLVCGVLALGVLELLPPQGIRTEVTRSYLAPRLAYALQEACNQLPGEYRRGITTFVRAQKGVALERNDTKAPAAEKTYAQTPSAARRGRRA